MRQLIKEKGHATIKLNGLKSIEESNNQTINRKMQREMTKAFDIEKETRIFRNSIVDEGPRLFARAEYEVTGKIN